MACQVCERERRNRETDREKDGEERQTERKTEKRDRQRNTANMENEFMQTVSSTHEPWLFTWEREREIETDR